MASSFAVFRMVQYEGKLDTLLELFDTGLASPFSVEADSGWTLLHYAVRYRFDFVEPLLHLGLDPLVEDHRKESAYVVNLCRGSESQVMALHQLSLSQGVYDGVASWKDSWVAWRMLGNAEVFDSMVANVFPDFYQWPLEDRTNILNYSLAGFSFDHKAVSRLFRPQGGFHPDDFHHRLRCTGQSIIQWITGQYFRMILGDYWWPSDCQPAKGSIDKTSLRFQQIQLLFHDIAAVSEYSNLSAISDGARTALVESIMWPAEQLMLASTRFTGPAYNSKVHRLQRSLLQQIVRCWLGDLRAAGKELEAFGQAEHNALLHHQSLGSPSWNSQRAGYKWKGFTIGPRPEDWTLIWEWDPDVETLVGDFWAWIEDPPLAIPGSWVDDDEDRVQQEWWEL